MSSKYIGRLIKVGVAKEASRGAGALPVFQLPETTFSFSDKIVQARSVGSLGDIIDSEEAFVVTKYGQGDIDGEIRSESFGLILYALLGGYSVSGPTDSAYTHTFSKANTNSHQSLAFVVTDPNTALAYKLVMIDKLEINAALNQVVNYVASFMSKKGNDTGMTVPAAVHEYKFNKKHIRFKVADTIGGLAAASAISLKSLKLTIAKNTVINDVLGTAEPEDIFNKQMSVEAEITLDYADNTWRDYMKNGTNKAVEIAFIDYDEVIGASTNPSLTFQLPKCDFSGWTPEEKLDDIATQKMIMKASKDVVNNLDSISLCQLVNKTTTY